MKRKIGNGWEDGTACFGLFFFLVFLRLTHFTHFTQLPRVLAKAARGEGGEVCRYGQGRGEVRRAS